MQELDKKPKNFRAIKELQKDCNDVNKVLHYQELLFIFKIIYTEFISQHYNDFLKNHFGINKIRGLIDQKYY